MYLRVDLWGSSEDIVGERGGEGSTNNIGCIPQQDPQGLSPAGDSGGLGRRSPQTESPKTARLEVDPPTPLEARLIISPVSQ